MAQEIDVTSFQIRRDDYAQTRFVTERQGALRDGQVRFRIDRFALTTNNITYAVAGDMLGYWKFFPVEEEGWGRIPVMGFADVIDSKHPGVEEGERVFGFFPMASHLTIDVDAVSETSFSDGVAHRAESAPVYRQYNRTGADPIYQPQHEDAIMLLRGLFMTSFLVDDFIEDNDRFGAEAYVVSSASSKTGLALGHLLARRNTGNVIGLTSARNAAFVEQLGSFDRVVLYEDVKSLPADVPTAFIDHSGNADVVNALHHHFRDNLKHSCIVGATHWDAGGNRETNLPGAEPTFFFAPTQVQKRIADWGPAGFAERVATSWEIFRASTEAWLQVVRGEGPEAVERVYQALLAGKAAPEEGQVLSLWQK